MNEKFIQVLDLLWKVNAKYQFLFSGTPKQGKYVFENQENFKLQFVGPYCKYDFFAGTSIDTIIQKLEEMLAELRNQ